MTEQQTNTNDAGIAAREAFIRQLLASKLAGEILNISPIAYEENFPFPYNNFVYLLEVSGLRVSSELTGQPGVDAVPETGTTGSKFIIRLPNSLSGYNDKVRVENEVAALYLGREALRKTRPGLVPRVYAWGSAIDGQGWILQEHMPGLGVLDSWDQLGDDDRTAVLEQMADVLAAFQMLVLPASVTQFGGLTFDSSGSIVSGPLSIYPGGPFETYKGLVRHTIEHKLSQADSNPRLQGWRENGIRARIDAFLQTGLTPIMASIGDQARCLVHADLSIDNILYDPQTKKLTAVLDFDFAHVSAPADEFLRSLGHGIGRFPETRGASADELRLQHAMLHGFPSPLPPVSDEIQWPAAKVWDDALRARKMLRPSSIANMVKLSEVFWLSGQILPFRLCSDVVVRNSSPEVVKKWKGEGEGRLDVFLRDHGF